MAPRLIAVVLALWGIALTVGLLTGSWPATLLSPGGTQAPKPSGGAAASTQADGATAEERRDARDEATTDVIAMTPRYVVCEGATGAARMDLHRVGAAPLLSVHCGARALWLGLHAGPGGTQPRIEAQLELPARAKDASGTPLAVSADDLTGSGRRDLIVPFRHVDAAGTAVEGGVALLARSAEGGLQPPRRLVGGMPLTVIHGRFDGKADAVALLEVSAARVAGEHQLRLLTSEPAPTRAAVMDAGDAHTAVALDLNLDGRDDVVLGGLRRSAAWWLAGGEAAAALTGHAVGPVRETVAGDLSGDGKRDALLVGDGLWVLQASAQGGFAPVALESTQCSGDSCMRDVHLSDVDADGKLDIVGYVHPGVRLLRNGGGLRFESRPLSRIEGDAMSILQTLVADLGGDGRADLLLLGHVKGSPDAIELAIVDDVARHEVIRLGGDPLPTPTAPLAARYTLR